MLEPDPLLAVLEHHGRLADFTINGGEVSGEAFSALAHRCAARLRRSGVGPGDVVLYQGEQRLEALALFWGAILAGGVFAAVDPGWPDYLMERAAGRVAPKVGVCDAARAALFERLFPAADSLCLAPPDAGRLDGRLAAWLDDSEAAPPTPVPADAPAAYLFTSGSTGTPKAVVHSRAGLARGAAVTLDTFGWRPGERLVNLPEPHTMSGLRNGLVATVLGGLDWRPLPASQRSNIFALLEALADIRCQRLVVGPALVRQLVQLGDRVEPESLAAVKAIYCTGATLSPLAVERFFDRFGVPILNYYGLTETGGLCVSQRLDDWRPDDRSVGRAAGAELRVRPADGGAPAPHGLGELQVRNAQSMSGYLGDAAATAARFDGDWLRTGDLVRLEPDGRCYLIGRTDTFIKTASTDRIAPEEIESVLEEHPAVADAAVLGAPGEDGFERIVALILLRSPPGDVGLGRQIADYVNARLGAARTPVRVCFVDQIPRQDNGKIMRGRLLELLNEQD